MPGDIVDIDGGVEVEIAWITGARGIARVPDTIKLTRRLNYFGIKLG